MSLPIFNRQFDRQKIRKAMATISFIRTAIENCGINNNNQFNTACSTFDNLSIPNPNNADFSFTIPTAVNANSTYVGGYQVRAKKVGGSANDYITVSRNSQTGSVGCSSPNVGVYSGAC